MAKAGNNGKSKPDRPAAAPALAPARKRRILLVMGLDSHARLLGIARYANQAGWALDTRLVTFHALGHQSEYVASAEFDGVIALLSWAAPWQPALVEALKVPVVDLWLNYPDLPYPRVLLDHVAAGRMGAEHLLQRGFRDLTFYGHAADGRALAERRRGFRTAVEAAGARYHELTWDETAATQTGAGRVAWLANHFARAPLPTGVMAVNDWVAAEVLEAVDLAGLRTPDHVAVLGCDNDPVVTENASVPLSSVDAGQFQAGYEAAALLDRMINGQPRPPRPLLVPPVGVVTRASTDILAVRDPNVSAAVQYIWEFFREPITVDDVARQCAISRRLLQDRFAAHVGHTIADEITRQRVNCAKRLLAGTDQKIRAVAVEAGFRTPERLSKVFRRVVGTSPQDYRVRYRTTGQPVRAGPAPVERRSREPKF